MFRVLGAETRVKIIDLIKSQGPLGAKRIAELTGITPAAASQHLKILSHAGLLRCERKGYWVPYALDHDALSNCCELLTEVCTCGCEGTCRAEQAGDCPGDDLEALRRRERRLRMELEAVQRRLQRLEAQQDT